MVSHTRKQNSIFIIPPKPLAMPGRRFFVSAPTNEGRSPMKITGEVDDKPREEHGSS
jgi:hypothetical protein